MIRTQRNTRLESKAALLALLLTITTASSFAGSSGGLGGASLSGIADREINRRMQQVHEAEDAIAKGDKYYADGDYEQALNEYKTALDLLPEAPVTQLLRDAAMARYCDAAVGLARERAKGGRYDDARTLLKDALTRNPEHAAAKTLYKQLDDPERFNMALKPEHVKNVADVNRHLELAVAYEELGDHDNSIKEFQVVLRIDKYNSAARQGMERVEQEKARYFATARDHTRAKMLNDVNKSWEEQVPVQLLASEMTNISNTANTGRYLMEKMNRIVFPSVQFTGASIDEAVEFLRIKSKDLDIMERDPARRGVNIILRSGAAPSTAAITLELRDVPMLEALRYITELAGMKYKVDPFAVLVVPVSDVGTEQYTRTFKVPPDFLTGGAGDGGSAPVAPVVAPDPFAPRAPGGGGGGGSSLPTRGTASAILAANGITFPEGSSATFIAATSQLIVKNTQPNLDAVEAFVDSLLKKIPQMINISAKFVEISQKNTDELGFDWLIGAFNFGAPGVFASGGTTGTSANGPVNGQDYPFVFPGSTTPIGVYPLTAGNRSGSAANLPNSIDGQIQGSGLETVQKAPGIFSISGVFTDPQFQVVIRALSQKKGVDLMSAPSVTTRSGQRASVEVVREFIYPTEFSPPQIPQNQAGGQGGQGQGNGGGQAPAPIAAPSNPSAFTMRPVGVKMEVEPVIGPDGYTIDLNLAPEVTEFDGFINYGSPILSTTTDLLGRTTPVILSVNKIQQPIFSLRKVQTAVTVWDGQTVAMGGLIREDVQDVQDKVPILGDLPLIGRLFQTKAQDHFKRNLMVFVTAKLIDPSGQPIRNTSGSTSPITAPVGGGEGVSAIPGVPGVLPPIK